MLVLTRRKGERVIISSGETVLVTIVVTNVAGGQATLAFGAGKEIRIDREEIINKRSQLPRPEGRGLSRNIDE